MRIVIDMQGAQTESRFRGIGRYTMSLALAIAEIRGEHEVLLALNGLFPETIEYIRAQFYGFLSQENIRVWLAPQGVKGVESENDWRRQSGELLKEAFLQSLNPDVILIFSLFEGFTDDALNSLGNYDTTTKMAVILYDLIPYAEPKRYLDPSPVYRKFYLKQIDYLMRADLLIGISPSSVNEARNLLKISDDKLVNVGAACDSSFRPVKISAETKATLLQKYGIHRDFVMYTGGADERKNLDRLIQAYSVLPLRLRRKHQLVFVGKMPQGHIDHFYKIAKSSGLDRDEVLCTGYVEDEELLLFYNLCKLFVFPSWHEGFGIPPLEAMSCGAPVIGANATSLPEVIGLSEALFDPFSVQSISQLIEKALKNEAFRDLLKEHGLHHSKTFSWEKSAKATILSLEKLAAQEISLQDEGVDYGGVKVVNTGIYKPEVKSVLALKLDHRGDLLLAYPSFVRLREKYKAARLDVVVGKWNEEIAKSFGIFDHIYTYDFFQTKSSDSPELNRVALDQLRCQLIRYDIAIDLRRQSDTREVLLAIDANLRAGYTCNIAKIDSQLDVSLQGEPDIPYQRTSLNNRSISLQMLDLVDRVPIDSSIHIQFSESVFNKENSGFHVGIFPFAGNATKEWKLSNYLKISKMICDLREITEVNIYIQGSQTELFNELNGYEKVKIRCLEISDLLKSIGANQIVIANNSFGAHLGSFKGLYVIGIYAGAETPEEWGPVFARSRILYRPMLCSPCHIASVDDCPLALECLDISPDVVFKEVKFALHALSTRGEHVLLEGNGYTNSYYHTSKLIGMVSRLKTPFEPRDSDLIAFSNALAVNIPERQYKQFFVDISELIQHDEKTGIQRVTRSILRQLLQTPPADFHVDPVYFSRELGSYRYAHEFVVSLFGKGFGHQRDDLIDFSHGDKFLCLDLQPAMDSRQLYILETMRKVGVPIFFVVYDLLPVLRPDFFQTWVEPHFKNWLNDVYQFDGAICISQSVAQETKAWFESKPNNRQLPLGIGWFHLGSDISASLPSGGLPKEAKIVLKKLRNRPTFLTVGTIEPRKGYLQLLKTFDILEAKGIQINVVIVGKQGWASLPDEARNIIPTIVAKLKEHPSLNHSLFWLEAISDEFLEEVYRVSTCLIAPSEGEGFGLPLIEGAHHGLPIIARDIPVFREVAGDHAYYFKNSKDPQVLANTIVDWLKLFQEGRHPESRGISCLSWQDSTKQLMDVILNEKWSYLVGGKRKENGL